MRRCGASRPGRLSDDPDGTAARRLRPAAGRAPRTNGPGTGDRIRGALPDRASRKVSVRDRRPVRSDRRGAAETPIDTVSAPSAAPAAPPRPRPRPWTVFASTPFRKLWAATALSLFGDFFSYIAMAWLVLQLTGSSVA